MPKKPSSLERAAAPAPEASNSPPGEPASIATAQLSICATQRGRFFWAAWWTGAPQRVPFRKADAQHGGASSWHEAKAQAEKLTGRTFTDIDSAWARAVNRTLRGQSPFTETQAKLLEGGKVEKATKVELTSGVWTTLGITPEATLKDIKAAFRAKALVTHPDQGGDAEAFQRVQEAYTEALRRRRERKPRAKKL